MIDRVSRLAERVATSVSRREFWSRLGRGAMALAAAVGGLLALPNIAQAAKLVAKCCQTGTCPHAGGGCKLVNACDSCTDCGPTFHCCQWSCHGGLFTFHTCCSA